MSLERDPTGIGFEEVISKAKELMLRDGILIPVVIIDGSKNTLVQRITELPDAHEERVMLLRELGESAARYGKVGELQQVFMATEGWMSISTDDESATLPSEDPNRMEVLIMSKLTSKDKRKQAKVFKIIREPNGQVLISKKLFRTMKMMIWMMLPFSMRLSVGLGWRDVPGITREMLMNLLD